MWNFLLDRAVQAMRSASTITVNWSWARELAARGVAEPRPVRAPTEKPVLLSTSERLSMSSVAAYSEGPPACSATVLS
jgi:hypothetical protein